MLNIPSLEPLGPYGRGEFHFICLCQVAEPEVTCIVSKNVEHLYVGGPTFR